MYVINTNATEPSRDSLNLSKGDEKTGEQLYVPSLKEYRVSLLREVSVRRYISQTLLCWVPWGWWFLV